MIIIGGSGVLLVMDFNCLRNVVNCQYGPNQESLLHRAVLENDR